jgi:stage V sporulation protein G
MRVTEVKVFPVTDEKLKAFVSVVLDNCFMVNDIKVIEGRDGRFISMPSRRKRNGKFKDIAHPLNSDTRQMLENEILGEYERHLNGDSTARERRDDAGEIQGEASDGDGNERLAPAAPAASTAQDEGTLEEVTEKHLSDSFWTS